MILKDKVAIVTGAAKGIGYAIALSFLKEGAKVLIADIDSESAQKAIQELSGLGDVHFTHCNVTEKLDNKKLITTCLDYYGRIDILVNNAGIVAKGDFLDLKEEDFDRVLKVNLKGPFLLGQAVARYMVSQIKEGMEPGCIINMSSVNAIFAIPDQVPYSVSKGGLNQLTKVMSLSLSQYGIRVNAIGPGSIMTDMLASVNDDPAAKNRILSRTPMGRIGKPEEIAEIACFLASNRASYITGQTVYADGGRLNLNYTVPVKDAEQETETE